MANDESSPEGLSEDLTDEIARKYDPERLLRMVSRKAGRGDPLDPTTRAKYEKRFGVDLGHVRVITGEFAEEFNRKREAYAVTVGGTGMILMGNSPDKAMHTAAGQGLLAHELTHVAQAQRAVGGAGGLHRKSFDGELAFGDEHEHIEREAELHEQEVASGNDSAMQAMNRQVAEMRAEDQRKADIEKIKARVLELAGDAARTQMWRNGNARRA